jgi:hypothetical protein
VELMQNRLSPVADFNFSDAEVSGFCCQHVSLTIVAKNKIHLLEAWVFPVLTVSVILT